MRGQAGYDIWPHTKLPPSFLAMDAWLSSQLNVLWFASYVGHWCIWLFFSTCYPWVFVEPGTGRRPIDCCRNQICMRGQAGYDIWSHTQLPPSFLAMDAWLSSQLNVLWFASYVGHWCIWLFFRHVTHGCL